MENAIFYVTFANMSQWCRIQIKGVFFVFLKNDTFLAIGNKFAF